MKTSLSRCSLGLVITLLCLPRAVHSAGVVNSATDAALRAAVAGGGTVTFNCEGTITLTGAVAIASSTVIDATGHAITISGGNALRLFSINSGVTAAFINLTLANGLAAGSNGVAGPPVTDGQPGMGGAILNNGGIVALTGCTVVSNTAVGGAGYITSGGIQNPASAGGVGLGGAVYNLAGTLSVTNCSFSANGATGGNGGADQAFGGVGGDACGGAIYSSGGNVTVQSSTFVLHTARGGAPGGNSIEIFSQRGGSGLGGAIWTSNSTAKVYNSTFTSNVTVGADLPFQGVERPGLGQGGAIYAASGVLNCFGCTFTTNSVTAGYKAKNGSVGLAQGGAIWSQASLSVSQSSIRGNQAIGRGTGVNANGDARAGSGMGGAIFNGNTFALSSSTFANNTANGGNGGIRMTGDCPGGMGQGGAICSLGTLAATNCTFVANSAVGGPAGFGLHTCVPGGDGLGGGLYVSNSTATLVNLTFASNNSAGGTGDNCGPVGLSLGGAIGNTNGTVNLYNSIVAYSTSGSNCWGTISDLGHNLSSDNSATFSAPGSLNNTDPKLGPLGNYGGPTLTLPLLAGSPAIDGGNTATAPATDQRGHARPYGAAADIGAFESSPPYFIGGQVSGSTLRDEVTIVIGPFNLATTNEGTYGASAIAAGSYSVTPTSPNYLFIPASRPVTVGPDQFGINFNAYHWNALSLEAVTNGSLYCIIADTNGLTVRMLTSTNLTGQWLPVSTNVVGPSNYFESFLPITSEHIRFYRTAIP